MREVNATPSTNKTQPNPIDGHPGNGETTTVTSQVGPWAMVPIWILSMGLTGGEVAVYVSLRSYCDRNGDCYPKTRTIAERAGCSVSAVRNAVQKFRILGILTTTKVYRTDTRELSHLRFHLVDLDPRRWNVAPREVSLDEGVGVTQPSDTPHSSEVHVSLSQVTQEHTNEHPTEQTNETSSPRASSSSSTPARKPKPKIDDDEAREKRINARKRRERANAKRKVIDRTGTDGEKADALLDHLVDQYSAGNLDRYVDGLDEDDLTERLEEATWEIEAERAEDTNRVALADGVVAQVANNHPDADTEQLDGLRATYVAALRAGHDSDTIVAVLNATHNRPRRGDPIDDYIAAIETLTQPVAA